MLVLIFKNKKVHRVLNTRDDDKSFTDTLNKGESYKTYDHTNAYIGLDMRAIRDDGSILTIEEQVEQGIIILEETEIVDQGFIRELTDQELRVKFPERFETETLEIDKESESDSDSNLIVLERDMREVIRNMQDLEGVSYTSEEIREKQIELAEFLKLHKKTS